MRKLQKLFAILGIVLLVSLYIITFVAAITSKKEVSALFQASLFCTIVFPIFLYGLTIISRLGKSKEENDDNKQNEQ